MSKALIFLTGCLISTQALPWSLFFDSGDQRDIEQAALSAGARMAEEGWRADQLSVLCTNLATGAYKVHQAESKNLLAFFKESGLSLGLTLMQGGLSQSSESKISDVFDLAYILRNDLTADEIRTTVQGKCWQGVIYKLKQ